MPDERGELTDTDLDRGVLGHEHRQHADPAAITQLVDRGLPEQVQRMRNVKGWAVTGTLGDRRGVFDVLAPSEAELPNVCKRWHLVPESWERYKGLLRGPGERVSRSSELGRFVVHAVDVAGPLILSLAGPQSLRIPPTGVAVRRCAS